MGDENGSVFTKIKCKRKLFSRIQYDITENLGINTAFPGIWDLRRRC